MDLLSELTLLTEQIVKRTEDYATISFEVRMHPGDAKTFAFMACAAAGGRVWSAKSLSELTEKLREVTEPNLAAFSDVNLPAEPATTRFPPPLEQQMRTTRLLERTYGISRPTMLTPPRTQSAAAPVAEPFGHCDSCGRICDSSGECACGQPIAQDGSPVAGGQGHGCPLLFIWIGLLLGCVILSLRSAVRMLLTGRAK